MSLPRSSKRIRRNGRRWSSNPERRLSKHAVVVRSLRTVLSPSGGGLGWGWVSGLALLTASVVIPAWAADSYPSRPVRLIVGYPPGGSTDIAARLIGQKLSAALGQTVVVDNRAGASGMIGAGIVARGEPDGHTLSFAASPKVAIYRAL